MAVSSTPSIDWYFDFVSPYSYICLHRLGDLAPATAYRPVLFAGLLQHWGHKGPAEVEPKRRWTYRWCTWWAEHLGIPFRFPASHPFNPLPHLRLALAAGCTTEVITQIFDAIWTTGREASQGFADLCKSLRVHPTKLEAPEIKDALKKSTERAISRGVFGVPTFFVEGELFWGADSIDFLRAYIADPKVINNAEMQRLETLPVGAARKS
jgi:2-hydroxychromene-2-carboxylate isomerase